VRALVASKDPQAIVRLADEVHMPTPRQMRALFPGTHLVIERWLGLPKSLIAVSKTKITGTIPQLAGHR
jgi:hypothetical protein